MLDVGDGPFLKRGEIPVRWGMILKGGNTTNPEHESGIEVC